MGKVQLICLFFSCICFCVVTRRGPFPLHTRVLLVLQSPGIGQFRFTGPRRMTTRTLRACSWRRALTLRCGAATNAPWVHSPVVLYRSGFGMLSLLPRWLSVCLPLDCWCCWTALQMQRRAATAVQEGRFVPSVVMILLKLPPALWRVPA